MIVGEPVHVPVSAVRVCPSAGVPEIDGATVLTGAMASMTALAGEVASTEPPAFVAVTTTRRREPMSSGTRS